MSADKQIEPKIEDKVEYLTINVADQAFGIPVLQVQDVLGHCDAAKIPLAAPEIAGILNLRGRIVTAIDVRKCLSLPPREGNNGKHMGVVVEFENELYSLMIDKVGDVLSLNIEDYENSPVTLDKKWRDVSMGVYRLDGELLVVLNVESLLGNIET